MGVLIVHPNINFFFVSTYMPVYLQSSGETDTQG